MKTSNQHHIADQKHRFNDARTHQHGSHSRENDVVLKGLCREPVVGQRWRLGAADGVEQINRVIAAAELIAVHAERDRDA
jgi:hypothetical protein